MADLQDLKKKVADLEEKYQEKVSNLQNANATVVKKERELLLCLQELTPLQNSYLTNIIKTLQSQNETLKVENSHLKVPKLQPVPEDEKDYSTEIGYGNNIIGGIV
jgi:hypothetical protein